MAGTTCRLARLKRLTAVIAGTVRSAVKLVYHITLNHIDVFEEMDRRFSGSVLSIPACGQSAHVCLDFNLALFYWEVQRHGDCSS